MTQQSQQNKSPEYVIALAAIKKAYQVLCSRTPETFSYVETHQKAELILECAINALTELEKSK